MLKELIFDVETQKLFSEITTIDPGDLGISVVSAYRRELDETTLTETSGIMQSFWVQDLTGLWDLFKGTNRIIGFNTLKFDLPALKPYAPEDLTKLPNLDIMQVVRSVLGRSLSLNALANATLNLAKTDSGVQAVNYWNSHTPENLAKLKQYCEDDVMLTVKLYDFGLKNKYLQYIDKWNNLKQIPVDFSYPKAVLDAAGQIGLF